MRGVCGGAAYNDQFTQIGELEDLEKSISYYDRALSLTPEDHPDISRQLFQLGVSYCDRFRQLGELGDLNKSIDYSSRALASTPQGHPDMSRQLHNLGASYHERFTRLSELEDLEQSIHHSARAVTLTPEDHPEMPYQLTSLGASYLDRFRQIGGLEDFEKAIDCNSRALASTPSRHPAVPYRLAYSGLAYGDRFKHLNELADLEKSIDNLSQALALTPTGHPDLPTWYFYQALSLSLRYQYSGKLVHLEESLDAFREASQAPSGAPRNKFQHALHWANLASIHTTCACLEAYQVAMDLLPQFVWLGATTSQRYQDLSTLENLPVRAASAAICSSQYSLALEWLEHARCVVWNQNLMLRSPLDELHALHPDLAARLKSVAYQLGNASSESQTTREDPTAVVTAEHAAQQHRRLAKEYNSLLADARRLPRFEDFLQPIKSDCLVRAAQYGPIIVINCSESRSDALLILSGDARVYSLPLPNFTLQKAQNSRLEIRRSLKRQGIRERGAKLDNGPGDEECLENVLKLLWDDVVKPVLDFLGYTSNPLADNLPHITWCPTGAVSFLPLHAAGDYNQLHSRAFKYAISSYTPTISALLSSSPTSLNPGSRVLGVGQEITSTPGYKLSKLPGTTKELNLMKQHAKKMNKVEFFELMGTQATKATVLDAMERHDWVHLACHGHQNVGEATKSGFFLHDGVLDLASINRRSFKNKGLAFLSACQTATGDEKLLDEAVHLASGLLMAGYSSVIATMWSVIDSDAPFVADQVYGQLMKDGRVGNGEAGKTLHYATAALRSEVGEVEFSRWVPYIHVGS